MTVTATPTVTVAGTVIAPAAPGALPPLVAVDALSVGWGRTSLLEHPQPAQASLAVLDTTIGHTLAARTDLIGQLVVLGWAGDDGGSGVFFRGRITDTSAHRWVSADGHQTGALLSLTAVSLEVDAGNYTVAEGTTWPSDSFTTRLSRIAGLMPADVFAAPPVLHPSWGTYTAAAVDVSNADALSLLRTLYDSTARPLIYDPAANLLTYGRRRFIAAGAAGGNVQHSAGLVQESSRWAATVLTSPGGVLDAQSFDDAAALTADVGQRITRAEVSWLNAAAAGAATTAAATIATFPSESAVGRRSLNVSTWHTTAAAAGDCLNEWASLATAEQAIPRPDPITWRTARVPFPDAATRAALLAGTESSSWWFLRRSWLPALGMTPLVGFIGGTIGYAAGEWTSAVRLAPAVNGNPTPPLPIRYAASSAAVRLADCAESLTFADLAHVTVGAGYTASNQPI